MGNCVGSREPVPEDPDESELYRSTGLYPRCLWTDDAVYAMVKVGKIAPRCRGGEERTKQQPEECPICMLFHLYLNRMACCGQNLCTECFLQVRTPGPERRYCPFCKAAGVHVRFDGARSFEELSRISAEREKTSQALERAKKSACSDDHLSPSHLIFPLDSRNTSTRTGIHEDSPSEGYHRSALPCTSSEFEAQVRAREGTERPVDGPAQDEQSRETSRAVEDNLILEEMLLSEAIRRSLQDC